MTVSIFILIGVLGTFIGLTISLGSINSTEFAEKHKDKRAVIMGDIYTVSREENAKTPLKYSNYIHILKQLGG